MKDLFRITIEMTYRGGISWGKKSLLKIKGFFWRGGGVVIFYRTYFKNISKIFEFTF